MYIYGELLVCVPDKDMIVNMLSCVISWWNLPLELYEEIDTIPPIYRHILVGYLPIISVNVECEISSVL